MDWVFNCPRCGQRLSVEERGAEMRMGVLERVVEHLAQFAPPDALSQADIERFREEVFADLHAKYPNAVSKNFRSLRHSRSVPILWKRRSPGEVRRRFTTSGRS
jgi:hypothetical protein